MDYICALQDTRTVQSYWLYKLDIISEFTLFICRFNVICRELCWELCWNSRWEVSIDVIPYGKPCGATLAPSAHHALGFVVILLFLGSVKTHDSSEKINK